MKKILMILIPLTMFFILVGAAGTARAALITFDDYYHSLWSGQDPFTIEIGDHYRAEFGVTFEHAYAVYYWNQDHVARQYKGDVAAIPYSPSGEVYSSSIFTFDYVLGSFSILADAYDADAGGHELYLDAYDSNDNLVKSYSQYLENGNWYTMSIDLTGVSATKIVIHDNGGYFGFNDMNFEPVPIPATIFLLAFALAGLIGISRRSRNS